MTKEFREISKWVGHVGVWDFSEGHCIYKSPQEPQWPFGICASNVWFLEGTARTTICFAKVDDAVEVSGRLVFGWRSQQEPYLSVGLGGGGCEFCVYQYDPVFGWAGVALTGSRKNLIANHPYNVSVHVQGQRVFLEVDSVQVLEHVLKTALPRGQLGLFAWGTTSVEFTNTSVSQEPEAKAVSPTFSKVVTLKPGLWGMSIDLLKALKWLWEGLHSFGRKQQQPIPQSPKRTFILSRLWRDPVWSKVIATGITAGIGAVWYFHIQNLPPLATTPAPAIPAPPPVVTLQPSQSSPTRDHQGPIVWESSLALDGVSGPGIVRYMTFRGTNGSSPTTLKSAYLVSDLTGEKRPFLVSLSYGTLDGEKIPVTKLEPLPPSARIQLEIQWEPALSVIDFLTRGDNYI